MKDINIRLREIAKYYGLVSYAKFAESTGLSHQTASNYLKGKQKPDIDKLSQIKQSFDEVNADWLLTGNEPMLKSELGKVIKHNKGTPLIPLDAMAGFGTGSMQVMDYDTKRYIVPEFDELNVDFMIRVKGSSMYPKYNSGDIVACKKLPLDTFFQWNQVYVLDTSQGAMIKRIHKSKKEGFLLLVSDNEKYKPFNIPIDDIYSLSIVIGVIRLE
jgi:phage repressor protein C with HTH and peptisase S24 domain